MNMSAILKRSAINRHGRDGHVETTDKRLHHELSTPVEMTGKKTDNTNSFELVAVAYSACFGGALQRALELKAVDYEDFSVEVESVVHKDEELGGKRFSFNIHVQIDGVNEELKQPLVDAANKICPFSKAIDGNVETNLIIL